MFLKRQKELIFIGLVGVLFVFSYLCFLKTKENRDISFTWTTQEYLLNNDRYCTYIYYPQLSGIAEREKEKRINLLIEKDVKKILNRDAFQDEWQFYVILDYEIKYVNNEVISILYKGAAGPSMPARGFPALATATTIDMKEEKILTLDDVVADYDTLNTLLLTDTFENISMWDGLAGQYKISKEYKGKEEQLLKELKGNDNDIEWYIDDGRFVIVSFVGGSEYNEYATQIKPIRKILKKEFLERLSVNNGSVYFENAA